MPEAPEIRIMSDFINQNSKNFRFKKLFHVQKGNNPIDSNYDQFNVNADFYGKQLQLNLYNRVGESMNISVFMGMSGNWKLVPTESWSDTKFTRMRLDREDDMSLLLYGGYMGPKYKIGGFDTKRGFDIVKDFDKFKNNVISNLNAKVFDKPICEVLLDQRYFDGVGAYLCSEIIGRLNVNPFTPARKVLEESDKIFYLCRDLIVESYNLGGGEIKDWINPIRKSKIGDWLLFYGNKNLCYKQKFGTRNIWIDKKFKSN